MVNKNTAIAMGLAALAVLLLMRKTGAAPGKANLSGIVTDAETGAPISGVQVDLDGLESTTGGNGVYSFTDVEPGEHTVTFTKDGYETLVM